MDQIALKRVSLKLPEMIAGGRSAEPTPLRFRVPTSRAGGVFSRHNKCQGEAESIRAPFA